jgi:hypothetical protein
MKQSWLGKAAVEQENLGPDRQGRILLFPRVHSSATWAALTPNDCSAESLLFVLAREW